MAHPGGDARGERLGREKELAWEPCPDLKGPEAVMPWPGMWCACPGAGPEAPCSRACQSASCTDRHGHALPGRSSAGFKTCVAGLVSYGTVMKGNGTGTRVQGQSYCL